MICENIQILRKKQNLTQESLAELVGVTPAAGFDVGEEPLAQAGGAAHGRFGREILGGHGAGEPDQRHAQEHRAQAQHHAAVSAADALVDDARHDDRDQQIEARLQHLEKRGQYTLLFIFFKQKSTSLNATFKFSSSPPA